MGDLSTALTVLTAMITPAVLIMACASLAISTSNRLSRVIERSRWLYAQFRQATQSPDTGSDDEAAALYDQLQWAAERSRLLQRALTCLYLSLSIFIATSVAIGLISITGEHFTGTPIVLGLFGAGLLFYTSLLLIAEVRLARTAINAELDLVIRLGTEFAPKELLERRTVRRGLFQVTQKS